MKKIIKIFLIEIFILTLVFSYFILKNNIVDLSTINNSQRVTKENEKVIVIDKDKFYKDIERALLEGKKEISLINKFLFKNPNEIFNTLEAISNNNPKVMYYKGAKYSFGKLELLYSKPKEDILEHQREVKNIRDNFLEDQINEDMTEYEKVLKIHDFIITNGKYDERLLLNGEVPAESYSTYGILSLGVGVCESYAKSMKYLLDGAGIESLIVVGKSRGENHAWNLVKLDDEYYHIDSTWNDPISHDGEDILRYNFFNLNDEEISMTHEWDRDSYPEAKGEKYNYFRYNNLVVLGENQLEKQLQNALLEREKTYVAKVSNFSEDIEINEIIEKIVYRYYGGIGLDSYSCSIDEEQGIISIRFFYNF